MQRVITLLSFAALGGIALYPAAGYLPGTRGIDTFEATAAPEPPAEAAPMPLAPLSLFTDGFETGSPSAWELSEGLLLEPETTPLPPVDTPTIALAPVPPAP